MLKIILFLFLFTSTGFSEIIGATKGKFSVNQGSAIYDLEIVTPKGIAGLKPKLSIVYNSSSSANGLLGKGFSISGLSSISKCNQSLFTDKQDSSRNYNYCLDGQELVTKVKGEVYGLNVEYKTKIDNYSKIIKHSNYWEVYTKDGLIYEYGKTSDSNNSNVIFKINKISDRYNNIIIFEYYSSFNVIKSIKYAQKNSREFINEINFSYEDREDIRTYFTRGIKYVLNKRLKKINIFINNQEESSYNFNYISDHKFSHLRSITECIDNNCLKPIIFSYKNYHKKHSSYKFSSTLFKNDTAGTKRMLLDINGDGRVDKLHVSNSRLYVSLNNGTNFLAPIQWNDPNPNFTSNYITLEGKERTTRSLVDINSDGLVDKLYTNISTNSRSASLMVQLNTGKGFDTPIKLHNADVQLGNPPYDPIAPYYYKYFTPIKRGKDNSLDIDIIDMNGDGYKDRIRSFQTFILVKDMKNNKEYKIPRNNNFVWVQLGDKNGINQQFLDMNADGLPDRVINYNHLTKEKGLFVALNNGNSFDEFKLWDNRKESEPSYYIFKRNSSGVYSQLLDINGDGLPDRVQHKNYRNNEKGLWVSLNTGVGFAPFENWFKKFSFADEKDYYLTKESSGSSAYVYKTFADVDSDGLIDVVYNNDVYFNTGETFIKKSDFFNGAKDYITKTVSEGTKSSLLDLNGDGFLEKVDLSDYSSIKNGYHFTKDKIYNITNHKNENIDIEYASLNDSTVYKSTESFTYPTLNIKGSVIKVVKSFKSLNSLGSKNNTTFFYEDLSFNLEYGNLGFKKIIIHDEESKTKSISIYNQKYPYIGMPKTSEVLVNDKKVSKSINEYESISSKNYLQVYLKKSIEESFDYDTSTSLITKTTINENIDKFGNIRDINIITFGKGEKFTKTVINKYENENEDKWIIGRLSSTTVSHKASGEEEKIRKSSFEYDLNYGTLIKEIIEPDDSKALIKAYTFPKSYKGNKYTETISSSDIEPRTITYKYDENFINLKEITNSLGHKKKNEYYSNNLLKSVTDLNGLITSFEYDHMGRKIKQVSPGNIVTTWEYFWVGDNEGHKVVQKINDKFPITIYYDILGRKVKTEKIGFDGRTIIEEVKYDKKGNKENVSTPYYDDESPEYINYKFDDMNRLSEIDSPAPHNQRSVDTIDYRPFETISKNSKGQAKVTKVNALGKTSYVDDGQSIMYLYDSLGNLKETRTNYTNEIKIEYDKFGNKIKQIDPSMGIWTYDYYSTKELKSQTDAKQQTTHFKYDKVGRVYEKNTPEGVISFIYDTAKGKSLGKLHKEIGIGITKEYEYDDLSRLKKLITKIGDNTYSQLYTYDELGRLKTRIEPNNITFINNYNENGYLESVSTPNKGINKNYKDQRKLLAYYTLKEIETKNELIKTNLQIINYEKSLLRYKKIMEVYSNHSNGRPFVHGAGPIAKKDVLRELKKNTKSLEEYIGFLKKLSKEYMTFLEEALNHKKSIIFDKFYKKRTENEKRLYTKPYILEFTDKSDYIDLDIKISKSLNRSKKLLNIIGVSSYFLAEELLENSFLYTGTDLEIYRYYLKKWRELRDNVNFIKDKKTQISALEKQVGDFTRKKDAINEFINPNEIIFYKVISKNALGITTEYLSGNGLLTKKEYDDRGILYSSSTGYETGENIRELNFEYDVLNNLTNREDKKLEINQAYIYDNFNRLDYYTHTDKNSNNILVDYTYDKFGNITNKSDLGIYEYSRGNKLNRIVKSDYKKQYFELKQYKEQVKDYSKRLRFSKEYIENSFFIKQLVENFGNDFLEIFEYSAELYAYALSDYERDWDNQDFKESLIHILISEGLVNDEILDHKFFLDDKKDFETFSREIEILFEIHEVLSKKIDVNEFIKNNSKLSEYYQNKINFYQNKIKKINSDIQKNASINFSYDLNGNMTKNENKNISYTSFNKPSQITDIGKTVNFYYDANNRRYKKTSNSMTTYYINKSYEENYLSNGEKEDKYFIYAEGKLVSTFSKKSTGYEVKYMHYDNLGSIDTVTNVFGVVEERYAYKPFGEKLKLDKYGEEISKTTKSSTNRGYTGHEHIEEFDLIHMNGRVYDPKIGRFLSADPHIQDPNNSQSYNRYSYVLNNPLKYTDPSGFFFKKINIFKKIKKYIKTSLKFGVILSAKPVQKFFIKYKWAQVVGSVIAGITAGPLGSAFWSMYLTDIHGGSFGDVIKSGIIAYASAEISSRIGDKFGHNTSYFTSSISEATKKNIAHGLSRAFFAKIQNQDATAQFWSGFVTSGFSIGNEGYGGIEARTAIMTVVGGTATAISGGKFANGAVSAAFVHLFNSEYDTFAKGMKALWDKKYEILNDHIEGVKGFFTGMKRLEKIDLSKHPEAKAFVFTIKVHRYKGDVAGRGHLKPLRNTKYFEPGTAYDIVTTIKKVNEYLKD